MNIDTVTEAQASLEKKFNTDFEWYAAKVEQQAKLAFHRYVRPFCRERKWRFLSGMGYWGFYPPNTRAIGKNDVVLDDAEWEAMRELLSITPPGFEANDLGSMMPDCKDYTEKEDE